MAIGDTITFSCKSGFEFSGRDDDNGDISQSIIRLPCTQDGSFAVPKEWPVCIPSIVIFDSFYYSANTKIPFNLVL